MDELGARPTRLIAVGGGTTADLWTQIVSDVTGRTQELPDQRIGASYGDALLAARAVDLADRTTSWATIGRSVEPRAGTRDVYEDLYTVYRDLYRATREQAHALAEQQRLADLAHPAAHPTPTSAV